MQSQLNELTALTQDLFYISETDASWQTHALNNETGLAEQLLALSQKDTTACIEQRDWVTFLQNATTIQDWMSDDEKTVVARYQNLKNYVDANLTEVEVYRIGEVEISVFIIGRTTEGGLIALQTLAVET
jgi:hypothetical protein